MWGPWRTGPSISSSRTASSSRTRVVACNEIRRWSEPAVGLVPLARGRGYGNALFAASHGSSRFICGSRFSASATAFRPTSLLLCSRHCREPLASGGDSVAPPASPPSQPPSAPSAASQRKEYTAELLRSISRRGGGAVRRARHGTTTSAAVALSALLNPSSISAKGEATNNGGGAPALAATSVKGAEHVAAGSPLLRVFDATHAPRSTAPSRPAEPKSPSFAGPIANRRSIAEAPRTRRNANSNASVFTAGSTAGGGAPSSAPPPAPRPTPLSRALLHKLLHTIRTEKRVPWDALSRLHPELLHMPLYACRHEWCEGYCARGSATPIVSLAKAGSARAPSLPAASLTTIAKPRGDRNGHRRRLPPLLLCAASTGTGKSVLIPLYALDAHWAVLERRLLRTIDAYDKAAAAEATEKVRGGAHSAHDNLLSAMTAQQTAAAAAEAEAEAEAAHIALQPFPLDSQESFIREFTACSRLRIVVSQPTRVACAELAAYASALLDAGRTRVGASDSTEVAPAGAGLSGGRRRDKKQCALSRRLVGKRVGFAVGGESQFCSETEIVFATPGYVLNALQVSHPQSSLSPTTLVVDEAHCRDIETDALLAWMKLSRECSQGGDASTLDTSAPLPVLRQYYVVSATMNLQAMDAYLCRGLQNGSNGERDAHPGPREGLARGPERTIAESDALPEDAGGTDPVSADAPLLLLSPMQLHHVRRWWQREQSLGAGGRIDGADVDSAVARAVTTDQRVRAAVLQLVEVTEGYGECDDGYRDDLLLIGGAASAANGSPAASSTEHAVADFFASSAKSPTETTARVAPSRLSPPLNPSELRGADGAVIVIATQPYRVERYFVDDLDPVKGCFARSQVLFDEATRLSATAAASAAAARTPSNALQGGASGGRKGGSQPKQGDKAASSASAADATQRTSRGFPMCLTDDGAALRARLVDLHGTRAASYVMLSTRARALVELILQLLQAARLRWIDGAAAPPATPRPPRSEQSYHADDIASEPVSTTLAAADPPAAEAPITVLVFVAGISELHQIMLALERLCDTVQPSPSTALFPSTNVADSSAPSTLVLRHGSEVFSVGLLHSTAVGSPQEQLTATEHSGAPLRLLLSTNVAESSLTIANTRVVVDTCLERRISTDDVTGATQVLTSFVSPSGLRQRCGRVGRTGDGVVIHLAPRRFVLPETLLQPPTTTRRAVLPTSSTAGLPDSSASTLTFEALPDGVATVLLRLKFLFAKVGDALAALPSPPSAAAVRLALQQLADMDLLLLPEAAETTPPQETTRNVPDLAARTASTERRSLMEASAASASAAARGPFRPANAVALYGGDGALLPLLDCSTFTPKGYFVASLPLPYEHAALVYYGLQFCCVEDALLVACAMAVPSLFLTPRVSSRSAIQMGARRGTNSDYASQRWDVDRMPALSPLEQFYRHLWVQRHLAGFAVQRMVRPAACPSDGGEATNSRQCIHDKSSASGTGEPAPTTAAATTSVERQAGQLSEPLMLRALLRQWYAFSNVDACIGFQNTHGLNRSAMRQVDSMVAQTCGRLIRLLLQVSTASEDGAAKRFVVEDAEAEVDFGAYVCQAGAVGSGATVLPSMNGMARRGSRGGGSTIGRIPFLPDWPAEAREQLLRSLRRLQRVAVGRVHLRHTEVRQRYGLPQWYDSEERWIRLWGRPYLRHGPTDHLASRISGRGAGKISAGVVDKERDAREAVQRHPCFRYWVDGLPALRSPYPSLYRQQRTTSVAVGGAITPFSTSVPPPLSTQVTRSKVPIYRPPVPPPPIPPVVFAMGRTDDRLCAAFVAAFGHRTLRGEDGGHRFHHRRLRRNMQALANDEEHVCTFHIDVQQQQDLASSSLSSSGAADQPTCTAPLSPPSNSYDLLHASGVTSKSVEQALSPYLRGAGLQQLEVFQSNRLAVAARFASDGFSGLFDSLSPSYTAVLCANGDADSNADEESDDMYDGGSDAVSTQRVHAVRDGRRTAARSTRSAEAMCGVATSEAAPTNARPVSADGAHGPPSEDLLKAVVLPSALRYADGGRPPPTATSPARDTSTRISHPYVQLAPFGVSLLTAATAGTGGGGGGSSLGSLQRIPLSGVATAALSSPTVPAQPSSSLITVPTLHSASLVRQADSAADERRSVRFVEVPLPSAAAATRPARGGAATATVTTTTCVAWSDNLGISGRSVTRAAVAALGLADLFPTAPPLSKNSSPLDSRGTPLRTNSGDGTAAASAPSSACTNLQPSNGTATPTTLTVSVVPPIYVTRSITWKVLLPALVPPASSMAQATHKGSTDAAPPPAHYCMLCNYLCSSQGALDQHYRCASHLEHLYHAVQLGLRREHLETLYGWAPRTASGHQCAGTDEAHTRDHPGFSESEGSASTLHLAPPVTAALPLASLLSLQSVTRLPLAQHVYPCVVGAQSFLNCLQWSAGDPAPSSSSLSSSREPKLPGAHKAEGRAAGAHRATPLAVAGSLVALQSVTDVLPPPHLRKPTQPSPCRGGFGVGAAPPSSSVDAETLSAHHVWVLNLSNSGEASAAASGTTSPPMSALLVVAGYLAAASPQATVALLLNDTHTHLHAVMLYGLGVWRLPTPLPMQGYMGLLEHIGRGGGWPGVLVPMTNVPSHKRHESVREEASPATHGPSDGLHWCAPEAACALSSDKHRCGMSASARALNRDAIVEATLLLVLHEYLHARRNMVTLADYVERVMHKLQLSPFVVSGARAVHGAEKASPAVTAADVLTAYLIHVRHGQTIQALLRDLGCVFATPPRALATLMQPARASTPARSAEEGCSAAQVGLRAPRRHEASLSPAAAALSKRLSYRTLGAEGAAVEMMFTVPPALPSRLPPVTFAAQLRQFYVDRHAHRWMPQRQASATPARTSGAAASTARAGDEELIKGNSHARPARELQARDRAGRLRGPRKVDKGIEIVDDEESLPQF
ncbi:hypothetical protein, conserved [Leishmania donovani]|uniref:Helicase C-terminal domain-containing protein n=1 Tax=Leishmania donovani TaxID=5661 RepID=E9BB01_LEIDO|nr:hypothetical protein, conserved [Leishmania donovani]CBZ32426.1 hypothetical protein, conserved [Leishmania donovani]